MPRPPRPAPIGTPPAPGRVVAYLRVSTDEQKLGPEAQRADIERWAERTGGAVVAWCEDLGVSGRKPLERRPGLLEALELARRLKASGLVVQKRDRLARGVYAIVPIELEIRRRRLVLWSAAGEGSGAQLESQRQLQTGLADLLSGAELAQIGERIRAALAVKRKRGEAYCKNPPLGLRREGDRFVEDQHEQRAIAFVVERHRRGRSMRAIVRDARAAGVTGRGGRPLSLGAVFSVLHHSERHARPCMEPGEIDHS